MTWWLDVLVELAEGVGVVVATADVWGPVLAGTGLLVVGWRLRPGGGRHRTPSAPWASARAVARTVASALVRPAPDGETSGADASLVTSADGRPAAVDGRPPTGGREDGGC